MLKIMQTKNDNKAYIVDSGSIMLFAIFVFGIKSVKSMPLLSGTFSNWEVSIKLSCLLFRGVKGII